MTATLNLCHAVVLFIFHKLLKYGAIWDETDWTAVVSVLYVFEGKTRKVGKRERDRVIVCKIIHYEKEGEILSEGCVSATNFEAAVEVESKHVQRAW